MYTSYKLHSSFLPPLLLSVSTCSGNTGSLSNISVVMGENEASIREVWSGLVHLKNGLLRLMKIFFKKCICLWVSNLH